MVVAAATWANCWMNSNPRCAFARAQGCTLIMGTGRKGWERAAGPRGYRFGWLTMVKSLENPHTQALSLFGLILTLVEGTGASVRAKSATDDIPAASGSFHDANL